MPKRPNPRAIKAARTYTFEEAASALDVTKGTVRSWEKSGLPVMRTQRPFLILGDELRSFLKAREAAAKMPLQSDQLRCFTCKVGRKPMGMLVDCILQTPKTARLMGLCEVCEGVCCRIISRSQLDHFSQVFCVAIREGQQA